jgi:hypothetical protein
MTRSDLQQMERWLARRARHGWSWAELSWRSGHPVWRLRYWQRRATSPPPSTPERGRGFVAVEITEPASSVESSTAALVITTPSGHRVTVAPGFEPAHLHRVLQALERGC